MPSTAKRLAQVASHISNAQTLVSNNNITYHDLNPTVFLPRAAAIEPKAPAIVHKSSTGRDIRRTYQEFADRARGLAYFIKLKCGNGNIGILAPNTPLPLEVFFAAPAAGRVFVAVNTRLKQEEVQYIFSHSSCDVIFADHEYIHLLEGFNCSRIIQDIDDDGVKGDYEAAILEGLSLDKGRGWDGLDIDTVHENDTFTIAYTSGTTSTPKGVECTLRGTYLAAMSNVIESGLNFADPQNHGCRYLWILPLFHAVGWTFPWSVVSVRGCNFCLRNVDYDEVWRLLREENITHFNAAPTVNTMLVHHPKAQKLPRQVQVTVAASPPSASLFKAMTDLNLMPVHVYGLTETYGPCTKGYFMPEWLNLDKKEMYQKMARQGHGYILAKQHRIIKEKLVKDENGHLVLVDVQKNGTEIGEVVFKGNILMKGYFKDPVATAKAFEGGWFHTGDLAVWHSDGSIEIQDRSKDIIISGGENISTIDVESCILGNPAVLECAVVAIRDDKWGERPKAYVTLRDTAKGKVAGEDIIVWTKSRIAGFKIPREVEIVDELPKTSTGKVKKHVLRVLARKGMSGN